MTTATLQSRRTRDEPWKVADERTTVGPLLVATDGSVRSDAAMRAALKISSLTGQLVLVLAVHAPLPAMGAEVQLATSSGVDAASRLELQALVREQLERVGITESWPVKVTTGYPGFAIAKLAGSVSASMIVMGLGAHGLVERIFGHEMALQVLRIGTVPVLAVAENFEDLPSRALSAVDFSAASKRALELGGPLVRAGGKVTLAHVVASDTDPLNRSGVGPPHMVSVGRALDRFGAEIELPDGVSYERMVLAGDPGKELLELAAKMRADLIITGSHGRDFLSRLILGSVSTRLLRKAGCSILIAPPLDAPGFAEELPENRARFERYEWAERLEEFTRRNLSRRARMEVIDPEIGAQVAEDDVPFLGASFDPRSARVHLKFGSREDGGMENVTHNIDDVTAVQMLRDRTGKDAFLRIGYKRGQTLLTLEPLSPAPSGTWADGGA